MIPTPSETEELIVLRRSGRATLHSRLGTPLAFDSGHNRVRKGISQVRGAASGVFGPGRVRHVSARRCVA